MDYQEELNLICEVFNKEQLKEFLKLENIGGCKKYHKEGNALIHTLMTMRACLTKYGRDYELFTLCLLHDIGKIYTAVEKDGDWSYPNHAKVGAENLYRFMSPEDKDFQKVQWYVGNHIKPLFWKVKGISVTPIITDGCSLDKLRKLTICDLLGSRPIDWELIEYLECLEL